MSVKRQNYARLPELLAFVAKLSGDGRKEAFAALRLAYPDEWLGRSRRPRRHESNDRERGRVMELMVCGLVNGVMAAGQSPFDLTAGSGARIEVKYACLGRLKGASKSTRSWTWGRLLGSHGEKKYERLVLVAQPNPACRAAYPDPTGEYVLFDLPFEELSELMDTKHEQIVLNSDPNRVQKSRVRLMRLLDHMVTPQELTARHAKPPPTRTSLSQGHHGNARLPTRHSRSSR